MSREISNALIESTTLGPKASDHRCFSAWIHLNYGGSGQGFGGFALDEFNKAMDRRVGAAWGMEFIARILDTLEVDSWENLKGKHLRVDHDFGKIYRIGHIIKDKWFSPEDDLKFLLTNKEAQ